MLNRSRLLRNATRFFFPNLSTPQSLKTAFFRYLDPTWVYSDLRKVEKCGDFSFTNNLSIENHHAGRIIDSPMAVIVETRCHPLLAHVINNVHFCTGLTVQLIHGHENSNTTKAHPELRPLLDTGKLLLSELDARTLSAQKYNALLLHPDFWHALAGRNKILFFQTDALLCPNSPYKLDDFLDFDYIGSWWPSNRPSGMLLDGGNGGLSLRDWQYSTQCLERFPPQNWNGGEDGYFAFHIDYLGGRVGRDEDMKKFGTQYVFDYLSFGAHHISMLEKTDPDAYRRFIEYCPEAAKMMR